MYALLTTTQNQEMVPSIIAGLMLLTAAIFAVRLVYNLTKRAEAKQNNDT